MTNEQERIAKRLSALVARARAAQGFYAEGNNGEVHEALEFIEREADAIRRSMASVKPIGEGR